MAQQTGQRWQDWLTLILGVWLFISPWVGFADSTAAAWNAWIFGAVIAAVSAWALAEPQKWEEWVNFALGAWLMIAPFVLVFSPEAAQTWNHLIIGAVVFVDALWGLSQRIIRRTAQ